MFESTYPCCPFSHFFPNLPSNHRHSDTFMHLARILNHAICISPPDAFHRHLADGLRAQFPDYPCLAHSPGNNPNLQQLLYVVSSTYATHAAYLKPPVLSLPEAWCFISVILTWSYTAALLLPPLRQRLTPSMQLAWLSANVINDMLIPPLAWGLFRGAPPSFVRHYLPTTIEALAYVGFIGVSTNGDSDLGLHLPWVLREAEVSICQIEHIV